MLAVLDKGQVGLVPSEESSRLVNSHLLTAVSCGLSKAYVCEEKGRMGRGIRHRVKKEAVLNGTVRDRGRKGTKATWIRTHDQNSR